MYGQMTNVILKNILSINYVAFTCDGWTLWIMGVRFHTCIHDVELGESSHNDISSTRCWWSRSWQPNYCDHGVVVKG
jgi:hypothetical protein